jgi:putative (di)nucleoside polyphosphate hydrolase
MADFRPNVCIAVRKAGTNLLLLCHRKGYPEDEGWQLPQGGIHAGADLISEMRRELEEETGIRDVSVAGIARGPYLYEFPKDVKRKHQNYAGQAQQWVLVDFLGADDTIHCSGESAEFDAWSWAPPSTVLDKIVNFKKETYARALSDLGLL